MVTLGVTGVSFHDIKLGVLVCEGNGGNHISSEINAENEHGSERQRHLEGNEEQEGGNLGNVGGESVGNGLLQVVENKATFFNTVDNGREVIIEQKHISGVLGNVRARAHSDTDIGLLDSRGIVDTVTSDSHDVTEALASIDNKKLLGGSGTGEDDLGLGNPVHDLASFFDFIVVKGIFGGVDTGKLVTMNDNCLAHFPSLVAFKLRVVLEDIVEFKFGVVDDVNLSSNGSGSWGLITSDHDNLDTGGLALRDGNVNLGAWGIVERNEANKSEVVHWEPSGDG